MTEPTRDMPTMQPEGEEMLLRQIRNAAWGAAPKLTAMGLHPVKAIEGAADAYGALEDLIDREWEHAEQSGEPPPASISAGLANARRILAAAKREPGHE